MFRTRPQFFSALTITKRCRNAKRRFLETFGCTVLTAPSGRKGLELAFIHPVDVVIVDYFMPEMNGQEFAIRMRRLRPQAPIVMLSAAVDVPKRALKLVGAFVSKDQLSSQLLPVIAQLHESQSTPSRSNGAFLSRVLVLTMDPEAQARHF